MAGFQRAAVLYVDFLDPRAEEYRRDPLSFDEMRTLGSVCAQGQAVENTQRKLIAVFPLPQDAITAGKAALHLVESARRADVERRKLIVRALLGYGEVAVENGRLQSDWTFRLPRLVSQLPDYALGATREFIERIGAAQLPAPPRPAAVDGLFVLTGAEAGETRMASAFASVEAGVFAELQLRVRGQTKSYKPVDCPLLVGRDKSCAVQLSGETSSRVHGRIEYEHSKFRYVDQSRNGSYVLTGTGEEIFLNSGEHIVLAGEGAISPGAPVSQQKGEVVRYECRTTKLTMDKPNLSDTQVLPGDRKKR